ncbi:hypothetical protein GCM10011575_27320 [Microlunatus endophyticus]|uniref:Methyltransferase domain-containing protein n=1 Tax=Microlunatus endophyticus TaxID=1716077 RepID=A0A917SCG9_9ACTN|nr:hypothetical protein GCM10011575_27320 [Microlunatus endophyticus]
MAAAGVEVEGVELSRAMVDQLRHKPGGESIKVTIGDMATTRVEGGFSLVYLVFNTISNLTSSHHIVFRDGTAEYREIPFRYVWPSKLDLTAQLAGMQLYARWEDWIGSPFTGESTQHVSVWQKDR